MNASDWSMAGRWTVVGWHADGSSEVRYDGEDDGGAGSDPRWNRCGEGEESGYTQIAERFVRQNVPIRTEVHGHVDVWTPYRRERRVRTWTECEYCQGNGVYDVHEDDGAYDSVACDDCDGGYLWKETAG